MNTLEFNFSDDSFNRLFPFYILIDQSLQIVGFGKSLTKICPLIEKATSFSENFIIKRPHLENPSFDEILINSNQLIVIENKKNTMSLRGQFELANNCLLFVGSPWFNSMHEVVDKNLTLNDFALHDPLIDLLHVLNNQENNSNELKELLTLVNNQKNKLKKDREELNRLSLVASANENGVVFTEPTGEIIWCNKAYSVLTGFSKEEIMGMTPIAIGKCEETTEEETLQMTIPFLNGDVFDVEHLHRRKDGSNFWVKTKGQPIKNEKGQVVQYFAMIEDISEQKKQEEQLYLLSLIAEKNINAVIISDASGRIEWANKSFLEMSGYEINEVIGKKPGNLLQGNETNPETVQYLSDRISKGLPFNCEIINYSKEGTKYWVNVNGQALYNKEGKIIKFFAIEEDVTEKKEMEEQREFLVDSLAKSNKELEDYASIVSHDLKSPLRSIHSLISWIKEDNEKAFNTQTLQYLSMIENKVEKMDHLIEGILTYAKIDKADKALENVNTQEIVQNIINIIHIPSHITVSIQNQLPIIKADRFRIQQLFQNLISNAVNYIDKPEGIVTIDCQETSKNYLFSVNDNGPGIAKENQEKIFKIFQSLQTTDKSTGLGLSIVKKIVEMYQGKIWIESKLSIGTTFFIKLNKS